MDDLLKQQRTLDSGVVNTLPHGSQNAGRVASGYYHEDGVLLMVIKTAKMTRWTHAIYNNRGGI